LAPIRSNNGFTTGISLLTGEAFVFVLNYWLSQGASMSTRDGILLLYLGASVVTFFVYRSDKAAASKDQWRTREKTLHLLGLMGGWPGALIAQKLLRHKTRKLSFQVVFWATVLINCAGLFWLLSPCGSHTLHSLL
jgi:uncharacterized membrane protein YsdA (DUF1294 family)